MNKIKINFSVLFKETDGRQLVQYSALPAKFDLPDFSFEFSKQEELVGNTTRIGYLDFWREVSELSKRGPYTIEVDYYLEKDGNISNTTVFINKGEKIAQ